MIKKVSAIFIVIMLATISLCACGNEEKEDGTAVDTVSINDIKINKQLNEDGSVYQYQISVNMTNNNDFECESINLWAKMLDKNGDILEEDMFSLIDVDAGQSGNAKNWYFDEDVELIEETNAIEIISYDLDLDEDDPDGMILGEFSKKHIYKMDEIPVKVVNW